jgi:hypothetical protein
MLMSYQEENELLRSAVSHSSSPSHGRVPHNSSQMADLVEKRGDESGGGKNSGAGEEDDDPEVRFPTSQTITSQQHPSDYISDDDEREG